VVFINLVQFVIMSEPDESSSEHREDPDNTCCENDEVGETEGEHPVFTIGASTSVDENTDSHGHTPSPDGEVDDAVDGICQNPEPPKELEELLDADNIGGTVFSKHWLFTILMRLLQVSSTFSLLDVTFHAT
jgi:hypothetical protein